MKTMKAENKEAHGKTEGKAEEASGFFTTNEKIDFSGVKIEPLFEERFPRGQGKGLRGGAEVEEAPAAHLRRRNGHGPHDSLRHSRLHDTDKWNHALKLFHY